jgi:hypothetical protein
VSRNTSLSTQPAKSLTAKADAAPAKSQQQATTALSSRADTLIDEINDKRDQIKQTILELTQERKEIDRQLGRLNAFLVRLGGGQAASVAASGAATAVNNGRLTPQVKEQLRNKVLEFLPSVSNQGMATPDIAMRLRVTSKRTAQIMSSLRSDGKVGTIGERAGMRYYRNGHA